MDEQEKVMNWFYKRKNKADKNLVNAWKRNDPDAAQHIQDEIEILNILINCMEIIYQE